jgi:DNA topoisomerase-1
VDPATGETIWLKAGRFGPYVEAQSADKPKRASLPKDWPPAAMDLDKAIRLLRLPREVGKHPDDGKPILAGIGRYGPYVAHEGTYANLPSADEVFEVGLNRAVAVLAEKRAGAGRGRGRSDAQALAELGAHPADGQPVRVLAGRYGPYVKHGATNANVPRGADPTALTLDEAVKLLAEREAKGPSKGPRGRSAARPATVGSKAAATAKKPAAKKKARPRQP